MRISKVERRTMVRTSNIRHKGRRSGPDPYDVRGTGFDRWMISLLSLTARWTDIACLPHQHERTRGGFVIILIPDKGGFATTEWYRDVSPAARSVTPAGQFPGAEALAYHVFPHDNGLTPAWFTEVGLSWAARPGSSWQKLRFRRQEAGVKWLHRVRANELWSTSVLRENPFISGPDM